MAEIRAHGYKFAAHLGNLTNLSALKQIDHRPIQLWAKAASPSLLKMAMLGRENRLNSGATCQIIDNRATRLVVAVAIICQGAKRFFQ